MADEDPATVAADDEAAEHEAKLREKRLKAEWRKMAKQLKAKDAPTKLAAISKCGEDPESLRRGDCRCDCLVPLLHLCVAKKKNGEVVRAALHQIAGFLHATSSAAGADGDAAPATHLHARLLIEAAEKKKNRVPGGKLFTDLFAHPLPDVAADALSCFVALARCASAADAPKKYAAVAAAGAPVDALAQFLKEKAPRFGGPWEAPPPEEPPEEEVRAPDLADEIVLPVTEALAFLLEIAGGVAAPAPAAQLVKGGGAEGLARCACAAGAPGGVRAACLGLLDAATAAPEAAGARAVLDAGGGDALVALADALATPEEGKSPRPGPPADLATCLAVLERTLESLAGAEASDEPPAMAPALVAAAGAKALSMCADAEGADACLALAAKCLGRAVEAFGAAARGPLTAGPSAAAATALRALASTGDQAARRALDKALHALASSGEDVLKLAEPASPRSPREGLPALDAALVAAAVEAEDCDAAARALRFLNRLADSAENCALLEVAVAPLLTVLKNWAAGATASGAGLDAAAGAALACEGLARLAAEGTARAALGDAEALATLDAALGRGPQNHADFAALVAEAAPAADAAAPAPAPLDEAEPGAPRDEKVPEAVAYLTDPAREPWGEGDCETREVAVRGLVANLLALLARPAEGAEGRAPVTRETAKLALDLACVDLAFPAGAPYWGVAAADDDELVREDVRAAALDLLAAVAAADVDALVDAARAWAPAGVARKAAVAEGGEEAPPAEAEEEAEAAPRFGAPDDVARAEHAEAWWPYVRALSPASAILADPSATADQHHAALKCVIALCRDPKRPAGDQPLSVDTFAAAAVAMGCLVPLCALASARTATTAALASQAEEDENERCPVDEGAIAHGAVEAAQAVADLAGRAAAREARLEARAELAYQEAYAAEDAAQRDAFEAKAQETAKPKREPPKKADKKGKKGAAEPEPEEEVAAAPAAALDEHEVRLACEAVANEARDAARADERGGPTLAQWKKALAATAPDLRRGDVAGSTALAAALAGGPEAEATALALVANGADVEASGGGKSPLHVALLRGSARAARALLEAACDADARSEDGANALLYAFVAPDGDVLDAGLDAARETWRSNPLEAPPETKVLGDGVLVKDLLDAGADANVADGRGKFPLHWAVEGVDVASSTDGRFPCVFGLSEKASLGLLNVLVAYGADVDRCDAKGATPLHASLRMGGFAAAEALLKAGAHPNLQDGFGQLPLHVAAAAGSEAMLLQLLDAGSKRPRGEATFDDARAGKSKGQKKRATVGAVLDAAFGAALLPPSVRNRLPPTSELLAVQDKDGRTPLHRAALKPDAVEAAWAPAEACSEAARGAFLAKLLGRDDVALDLIARPAKGVDCVYLAAEALGDAAVPVFEAALARGYDLDAAWALPDEPEALEFDPVLPPNQAQRPPTAPQPPVAAEDYAESPACAPAPAPSAEAPAPAMAPPEAVPTIAARAWCHPEPLDVADGARTFAVLHACARRGASAAVEWLLSKGASPTSGAPAPLALAALDGSSPAVVEALVVAAPAESAFRPDGALGGSTPAHAAAARGFVDTALAMGAGDARDSSGRTTALAAAYQGRAEAVAALLESGVPADARDVAGFAALDVAIDLADPETAKAVVSHARATARDVLRSEAVHCSWADAALAVPRSERGASPELAKLRASAAVFRAVAGACPDAIAEDAHLKACFADGTPYGELLLRKEQQRLDYEEREAAARAIQLKIQARNRAIAEEKRLAKLEAQRLAAEKKKAAMEKKAKKKGKRKG